jgi:hypothetical protein
MNNGIAQPDASYRVCIPPRNSNNCVLEAALSESIGSLVNTLRNYIIPTNDILIAAGIKVWKNNIDGSASMLFVTYLRALETNNPVLFLPVFKSFGNQALDAGQVGKWSQLCAWIASITSPSKELDSAKSVILQELIVSRLKSLAIF